MVLRVNHRSKLRNIRRELSSFLYTESIEKRVVQSCYWHPESVGHSFEYEGEEEADDMHCPPFEDNQKCEANKRRY